MTAVLAPDQRREVRQAQRGSLLADHPDKRSHLDGGERLQVLDALITVIGGAYAHLPAKRAAYAVDPVQALTLLRRRASELTDADFHLAVSGIVTGLRDAHTRYIGPSALHDRVAALPFLIEQYGTYAEPGFVVTKTVPSMVRDPEFKPGVRIVRMNAVPIARAVDIYSDHETGGRADARRARALESFTFRALSYGPPPDEQEIVVDYRTRRGALRRVTFPWRILSPERAASALRPGSRAQLKVAIDSAAESVRRAKKLSFAPELWAADRDGQRAAVATGGGGSAFTSSLQDVLAAKVVRTRHGKMGYLRIWSFDVDDDDEFVAEIERLLRLMPQRGVIVDLRANPGGLVWAAERLLQLFTDQPISPTRFSLFASPLTRAMAQSPFNRLELEAWAESLEDAVSTGELYSQPLPLTDPDWCNDRDYVFPGPKVAIVDANTYSSGDLFSAGWADHSIGPLVCVGEATGAGGANVWTGSQLRDALMGTDFSLPSLPDGIGFSIAIRRAIRSGSSDGVPIEDLGISGISYGMTERDVLDSNHDLLAFCAQLLGGHR